MRTAYMTWVRSKARPHWFELAEISGDAGFMGLLARAKRSVDDPEVLEVAVHRLDAGTALTRILERFPKTGIIPEGERLGWLSPTSPIPGDGIWRRLATESPESELERARR